ncbi:MAG: DUF4363 family protein [Oscillospiraceae bacterium]|nr:DUF4363 family protein [Oscillospiraceae bacterium]
MKKELISLSMLILLILASIVNIHFLTGIKDAVSGLVEEADKHIREEDWERALESAEKARKKWDRHDAYIHMVLRQTEIESVTSSLNELSKELLSQSNTGAASGAARAAVSQLKSIASVERIKLRNIF